MNNKVVYNLHYAFYNLGFTVLRFNFRGVGRSQGEYDLGIGELSRCRLRARLPAVDEPERQALLGRGLLLWRLDRHAASDAPPRNHRLHLGRPAREPLRFQLPCPLPVSGLIINGTADKVAPPKDTMSLVNKLHEQKGITITHTQIEGADHFFKDEETHMKPMIDTVSAYVKRRLTEASR